MSNTTSHVREELIRQHGEQYRALITDALAWLDAREPTWQLNQPLNREVYIADLISKYRDK